MTTVYMALDAQERVLYVGVTDNLIARLKEHRRARWWPAQRQIRSLELADRQTAELVEAFIVNGFHPPHNGRWTFATEQRGRPSKTLMAAAVEPMDPEPEEEPVTGFAPIW